MHEIMMLKDWHNELNIVDEDLESYVPLEHEWQKSMKLFKQQKYFMHDIGSPHFTIKLTLKL